MRSTEDGGPAFPVSHGTGSSYYAHPGMDLRDYFAGQALAGLLANENAISEIQSSARDEDVEYPDYAAEIAYNIANSMLKARES